MGLVIISFGTIVCFSLGLDVMLVLNRDHVHIERISRHFKIAWWSLVGLLSAFLVTAEFFEDPLLIPPLKTANICMAFILLVPFVLYCWHLISACVLVTRRI